MTSPYVMKQKGLWGSAVSEHVQSSGVQTLRQNMNRLYRRKNMACIGKKWWQAKICWDIGDIIACFTLTVFWNTRWTFSLFYLKGLTYEKIVMLIRFTIVIQAWYSLLFFKLHSPFSAAISWYTWLLLLENLILDYEKSKFANLDEHGPESL